MTEVAVAGLASGFAVGANEDAIFFSVGVAVGFAAGFDAADFAA